MASQFRVEQPRLVNLIDSLRRGDFVIPNFQRDIEWKHEDVRQLMRSIFNDFFIGTLFLWSVDNNSRVEEDGWKALLECEPIPGSQASPEANLVLDGQQRLTAMYSAFFGSDDTDLGRTWFFIDIKGFAKEDESNKVPDSTVIQRVETKDDRNWFSKIAVDGSVSVDAATGKLLAYEEAHGHWFPLRLLGMGGSELWLAGYIKFWSSIAEQHRSKAEDLLAYSKKCFKEAENLGKRMQKSHMQPKGDGSYQKLQQNQKDTAIAVEDCKSKLDSLREERNSLRQQLRQTKRTGTGAGRSRRLGPQLEKIENEYLAKRDELKTLEKSARQAERNMEIFQQELDSRASTIQQTLGDPPKIDSAQELFEDGERAAGECEDHQARADEAKANAKSGDDFRQYLNGLLADFKIPTVQIDGDMDPDIVSDMFSQLNQRGKTLRSYDLLNAYISLQRVPFKQIVRDFKSELEEQKLWWDRAFEDVMRIMLIDVHPDSDYSLERDKYTILFPGRAFQNITPVKSAEDFIDKWKKAQDAYTHGLNVLRDESFYGRASGARGPNDFVPYAGILPVYCSLLDLVIGDDMSENRICQWYWASVLTERYLSAQDSSGNVARGRIDYNEVGTWLIDGKQKPATIREMTLSGLLPVDHDSLRPRQRTSEGSEVIPGLLKGVRGLFFKLQPQNWQTGSAYTAEDVTEEYVVNQQWCKQEGVSEALARSVFNEVLVDRGTGEMMREDSPKEYLKRIFTNKSEDEVNNILQSHCISPIALELLTGDQFSAVEFEAFLEERRAEFLRRLGLELFHDSDLSLP